MHYFIIAGEASGDLHASELIKALRRRDSEARFTFLGGDLMAEASGSEPVIHYRDMAYMGFVEVVKHIFSIMKNMRRAKEAIVDAAPDCLILVDYPSFNLKMAAFAKKRGIPVYYYISPKVWAWKKWRVKTIRKLVDRMAVIFPFEVDFYRGYDYAVSYVGNPSVAEVAEKLSQAPSRADFLAANRLRDRKIVALLPGSRRAEIADNLPVMVETIRRFPQYRGVVAGAPGIPDDYYRQFTDLPVLRDQTYALLAHAHAALVTSGTATLETALAGVPQVVLYRSNGWKIAYDIMKKVLDVRFVSLPNLIVDEAIIPEMLLHLCTPDLVGEELAKILPERAERQAQLDGYARMRSLLGDSDAADGAAALFAEP